MLGVIGCGVLALALCVVRRLRGATVPGDHEVVTVAGVVQPLARTIEAPLSGHACVAHRSRARLYTVDLPPKLIGEPLERGVVPFVVHTPRGRVLVACSELELELEPALLIAVRSPRHQAFLERHGFGGNARASFDEIVIEPGQIVTLRGTVRVDRADRYLVASSAYPVTIVRRDGRARYIATRAVYRGRAPPW